MWHGEGGGLGELCSSPLHPQLQEPITAIDFNPLEEALWTGTEGGLVGQLLSPTLERYCTVPAHQDRVVDLRAVGEAAVSLSSGQLCVHSSGGAPRLTYADEIGDLSAFVVEPRSTRAVLGRAGGGLMLLDLKLGKPSSSVDTGGRGVVGLCGPTGRGALVMASADGYVSLLDPRTGYKAEHSLLAHAGGFAALDARGELLATCGYANRMGRLSLETYAKVFDVRMTPRMLSSVPFAPGPSILRFHPRFGDTLLLASAGGAFTLANAQGMSSGGMYQVDTEGDALVCAAISSTGECLAFGGSGGYVHLWATSAEPSVNQMRQVLTVPEPFTPMVSLSEEDPLSAAPTYFPMDGGGLLSELGAYEEGMAVGLPPRVVDGALLKSMKQSDFVGYIQNPHFLRGALYGAATRAAAAQRNQRVQPQPDMQDQEAAKAERARRRAAAGGIMLPGRYKRVQIKQQQGLRFEEFDFSYYNRTPFTGLENDLANCYTNALLQVLFFTPAMRDALMQHVPDAASEFSLTCEMSFLFRMLATAAQGTVCQAANLLRALRQNKEAAGLGLLEGVKGERGAGDIEVEAKKDRSLSRRVQSLSRFLLEALNKEGSAGGRQSAVDAVYCLVQRQRTQCLSRPNRPDQVKETRVFQMDLLYPPGKDRPAVSSSGGPGAPPPGSAPTSPDAKAGTRAAATAAAAAAAGSTASRDATGRPSFAGLLQQSLKVQSEMRAWFDEEVKYQYVRQTRVPKSLPEVLVVNCGLQDREDLCWWQPYSYTAVDLEGEPVVRQRPWLPAAVAVTVDPEGWAVTVQEAGSTEELLSADASGAAVPPGGSRAVYELTAVVALIRDEDESEDAGPEYEGHLVSHIKVPPTYFEAQQQSPASGTPHSLSRQHSDSDVQTAAGTAGGTTAAAGSGGAGAAASSSGGGPTTPRLNPVSPHEIASMLLPGAGAAATAAAARVKAPTTPSHKQQQGQQQLSSSEAEAIRHASESLNAAMTTPLSTPPFRGGHHQRYNWMVFNDFHITPSMPEEVAELYGGQKLPCLLYYTQVEAVQRAAECAPVPPRPVLTQEGFLSLCRMPPLQGPKVRLHKPTFAPMLPNELPQPGTLFALDAEFVAYSPPEKALQRGSEVEVRPSRLGLARVSVLRGQGPAKGAACIDDYIRSAEQVHDYLTKFSGLVPGDLDPARSPHYLTTLRRAYLKLRHLVDAGAVFVGHGLKKDFRMINIVVPPAQIVDTVDLFHAKRSRKLSLRFLASHLLRCSIQEHTHDSIEDAATALKLYDVYQQLVREGTFEAKLAEMYDWGKRFGWEPVIWKDDQPHPAPQQPPGAAMAAAYANGGAGGPGGMGQLQGRPGGGGGPGAMGPPQHHQQQRGMHAGMGGPRGPPRR